MRRLLAALITVTTVFVRGNNVCENNKDSEFALLCRDSNITVNFANMQIGNLGDNFLSSPLIQCLQLNHTGIQDISTTAFDNLPNLKYLDLSNNRFSSSGIENSLLPNLEILILNSFGSMYEKEYQMNIYYPKLRKLFLENNNIISINSNSKYNFPSLTHLYLRGNRIRYDNFDWLPKTLEYLDISGHNLDTLTLKGLNKLKCLIIEMSNNEPHRKELSDIKLVNLSELKVLSLSKNDINKLSASAFINLSSLIELDISQNALKYIEVEVFDNVPALQNLNLSNNRIEIMEAGLFNSLRNLKTLSLEKNSLVMFPTLTNDNILESIWLHCNKIKTIIAGTFAKMPFLQYLYLHDNEIAYLDAQAFIGLSNLKVLTLSYNQLFSLPANWLLPMTNLVDLDLAYNNITDIEHLSLSDTTSLQNLYLSTQLRYIRSKALFTIPENITINMDPHFKYTEQCNTETEEYSQRYYG